MTVLHPCPVSTRQLSFDPTSATWIGEISSTNGLGQVYDDACDVGLTLVSARTGDETTFVVTGELRYDGQLAGWNLEPVEHGGKPMKMVLFND